MKLEVIRLKKEFNNISVVNNLSFSIETGEITGFIGQNGAGKTTTMKMIASFETVTDGDIKINGYSLLDYPELIKKHIGYVPDSLPSNDDMTVHEYLDFFACAYGFISPLRQKVVKEIEELTKIINIREKTIDSLSKGMKQRVSISRALISNPDFILMDEPAAGLDPKARNELRDLLKFLKFQGKGILISSHILNELSEICDNVIIIEQGKLLKSGKIEDIVSEETNNEKHIYQIKTASKPTEELIKRLSIEPNVSNIKTIGNNIEFEYSDTKEQSVELVGKLLSEGFTIVQCGFKEDDLESVFMKITKGTLQ